jgi:hypothetical protein
MFQGKLWNLMNGAVAFSPLKPAKSKNTFLSIDP